MQEVQFAFLLLIVKCEKNNKRRTVEQKNESVCDELVLSQPIQSTDGAKIRSLTARKACHRQKDQGVTGWGVLKRSNI